MPTARNDMYRKRRFHCPHSLRYFYSISRNADVTKTPDVKYASQKTRGEISLEVNFGFLSGRFLGYSLREFGSRRPLEMTDIGNALKARNNMFWKCTNRTKQQQFNVSTCRRPAQNSKEFWASFLQKKIREAMKPLAVGV